jgi:pimeloyl-ACP methyl ester carboxylesterase
MRPWVRVIAAIGASLASLTASSVPIPPDRGDLGLAYLRFERAVASAAKDPATRRRTNMAFDALTGDFFAGRFDRALSRLAEIEGDLAGEASDAGCRAERAFLASHRFEVEPRLAERAAARTFRVRAVGLDGMSIGAKPTRVLVRQGRREIECVVETDASSELGLAYTITLGSPRAVGDAGVVAGLSAGPVEFIARMAILGDVVIARAFLLEADPALLGDALSRRIDALDGRATDPVKGPNAGDSVLPAPDASTIASLRARHELAFGAFDRSKSADLLADPSALAVDLDREITAVSLGRRPYAVPGDTWRVLRVLGTDLPVRQFIPDGAGPFPLIVAFHGAGGDENLFFDGYGAGRLREIARARGFAVVCPPTVPFGLSPNVLTRFLDELAKDVPFDPARVGLVGHSLGAVTASRLAVLRPDAVNGAVCIAGFADLARNVQPPPRLVLLAELDPLFPLASTRAVVESAQARDNAVQPDAVQLRVIPHEGHTLVVGEVLDQAIDWLLARPARQTAPAKPTASAPSTMPMNTGVPSPADSESSPSAGPRK